MLAHIHGPELDALVALDLFLEYARQLWEP